MIQNYSVVAHGSFLEEVSLMIRSAVRRAPIIHNGTPFPGRVDAPVKYRLEIKESLIGGRNILSWFNPCDRPKAAP